MLDLIAQVGIVAFGVSALWLVNSPRPRTRRWGPVLGLLAQPFWLLTTLSHGQYGIAAMCLVYGGCWARGLRHHWRSAERPPADESSCPPTRTSTSAS